MDAETGIASRAVEATIPTSVGWPMPTMAEVKQEVCAHFALLRSELEGKRRFKGLVYARQIYCFLAYRYCGVSLHQVARKVGHRDHSTVYHSFKKIEALEQADAKTVADLESLRGKISLKVWIRTGRKIQCG